MLAPDGYCWLCNKYGKLTKEHIPPEKAFNACPLLLKKIDERSVQSGVMAWVGRTPYQHGMWFHSLCGECNNGYGGKYGRAYVDLVQRIAERIGDVPFFHKASILGVQRPLAILKQVMLQFVTANGASFVRTNEWVAQFITQQYNTQIPRHVCIYLFASNMRGSRSSGVSAHIQLEKMRTNVVAEFTFWPLGTVISFDGELSDQRLTPIHQWAEYPFNYPGSVDLHLSVNPIASDYPIDFRTESQVQSEALTSTNVKRPSKESLHEMMKKAQQVSGETDGWVHSGHPNTVRKALE